jgi:site-specific recombinase XerD
MTESDPPSDRPVQLPAVISPGALTGPMDAHRRRPGAGADRQCRRRGRLALCGILHRQHPQPEHTPRLCAGMQPVLRVVRRPQAYADHNPAVRCRHLLETLGKTHSAPGVKRQLAAVRMLFDWLITGQVAPSNPASAVRGPTHVVKTGTTPVLEGKEWRRLIDAIPSDTARDLRDRALIATLTYGLARIGAALKMRVEDLQSKGSGWLIRLHEKGGKQHMMPCHHALAEALHAYIAAGGIAADKKAFLFRTSRGHGGTALADQPMTQVDAWRMVRKRALAAGIMAPIGNHSFRATGITAYLANGGTLKHAQSMAAHESPRTTKLYDRTNERLTHDEVERIML